MPGRKTKNRNESTPPAEIAAALLEWYGANARVLPWRAPPTAAAARKAPDPYAVWLSEVMLQQTTVATVGPRFLAFLRRWPTVEALAAAALDDVLGEWAGLGYYARARNLHKCAAEIATRGAFPDTEEELRALPGIGAYTAAAVAAIAFDKPAVVVDGNVERVMARLFAIATPLPAAKPALKEAAASLWPGARSGDFAQALMDLGAGVCTPRNPQCAACPLRICCLAFSSGEPAAFPKRASKTPKPKRYGAAFVLFDGARQAIVEKRPEKGLLGGMLGFPGTPWETAAPNASAYAPLSADWRRAGAIEHTFTHFHLQLDVYRARAPQGFRRRKSQQWIARGESRLPTVMRKALVCALASEEGDHE